MKDSINTFSFINQLEQSELFGEDYASILNFKGSNPTLSYFVKDVAELLNKILLDCNNISSFQTNILHKFFVAFNDVRKTIDPNRLASFEYCFNDDDELVLFRNTSKGLTNIIINPDECFALSYIPKDYHNPKSLDFYYEDHQDFEGLAYRFFS